MKAEIISNINSRVVVDKTFKNRSTNGILFKTEQPVKVVDMKPVFFLMIR